MAFELPDGQEEQSAHGEAEDDGNPHARPDCPGMLESIGLLQVGEDQADDQRGLKTFPERDYERSH